MKTYNIQVTVKEALVTFEVRAKSLDDALAIGREELKKKMIFAEDVELIDTNEEITGVY